MLLTVLRQLLHYPKKPLVSFSYYPSMELLLIQHAVRTPLSVLISCINELEESNINSTHALKKAKQAIRHLQSVTQDLAYSEEKIRRANIKQVVKRIICLLRSKNCNIIFTDVTHENNVCTLPINEVRLTEAFACVINNALAANKKSTLPVHITYYREKGRYRITIRDFGPGMNFILQRLVHLPHFTLKQAGSGLGLYFAKHVIEEELKGNLRIYSEPKHGTLVECLIPDGKQNNNRSHAW